MIRRMLCVCCYSICLVGLAQMEQVIEKFNSRPEKEETAIWLCDTALTFKNNDPSITQQLAELALEKAHAWNSTLGIAKANHVIGIAHWSRGFHESAIDAYLKALAHYENLGFDKGIATIKVNIATIYDSIGQPYKGKNYLLEGIDIIRSLGDTINLGRALNNLAIMYGNLSEIDSAIFYFKECLWIKKHQGDSIGIAHVFNNIADLYLTPYTDTYREKEKAQAAHDYLIESLQFIREGSDNHLLSIIYANLGKSLMNLNQMKEAKTYLEMGLVLANEIESRYSQQLIYGYLSQLHEAQGDYKKALEYTTKEVALYKEQRSMGVSKQINKLNIQFETEKEERLLAEFEKQQAINAGIRNILLISIVLVCLIAFLLLSYVRQKQRKDELISQLKLKALSERIDAKNKEISSYTINFLQKNQLMSELKEQINELKRSGNMSTNKELTRINKLVDTSFRSDEEWKNFRLTFNQMHDDFFKELKKAYPSLSNPELKLCALLRLNMNLKESAKILSIQPGSVKTARYRLRKKFNLKKEEKLNNFLHQFEGKQTG